MTVVFRRVLNSIPDGSRERRHSMLQSIDVLRFRLNAQEIAYHNELMLIVPQIDAVDAQIKEIQQSTKGLRTQRDDATACYQQERSRIEALINGLQEEITAYVHDLIHHTCLMNTALCPGGTTH
jgi:hypothetical protein